MIDIFCDGACIGNPGPGGWGAIIRTPDRVEKEINGGAAATSNRMELTAAVMNRDLWEVLLALSALHDIDWRWVRGHNGHAENERCDVLANEAARAMVGELKWTTKKQSCYIVTAFGSSVNFKPCMRRNTLSLPKY